MAKRTYNRRGRKTAKTPVTSSARRPQRIKGAQTARRTGSKDKMTVSGQRSIKGGPRGAQGPANPPQQGPSRRVSGMIGSRTTPATKTHLHHLVLVKRLGLTLVLRPLQRLAPLSIHGLTCQLKLLLQPLLLQMQSKHCVKSLLLKKVLANPWQAWAVTTKLKKRNCPAQPVPLTLTLLLPRLVKLAKRPSPGVANDTPQK